MLEPISFATLFPRVENPWPDHIGLGFPFAIAGAFTLAANVMYADSPASRRERVSSKGGLVGFWIGFFLYLISLLAQVLS